MNKYKCLIIIMFLISTFSISKVYANINDLPLLEKKLGYVLLIRLEKWYNQCISQEVINESN